MFKTIIVGTDGSEPSKRALNAACKLAGLCGGSIVLVHTPRPDTVAYATEAIAGYGMITALPPDEEVKEAAKRIVDDAMAQVRKSGCTAVEAVVRNGDPGDEILAEAKERKADLIVTGRRGLGNIAGLVMGSTSQRIAHLAQCSVLSVP